MDMKRQLAPLCVLALLGSAACTNTEDLGIHQQPTVTDDAGLDGSALPDTSAPDSADDGPAPGSCAAVCGAKATSCAIQTVDCTGLCARSPTASQLACVTASSCSALTTGLFASTFCGITGYTLTATFSGYDFSEAGAQYLHGGVVDKTANPNTYSCSDGNFNGTDFALAPSAGEPGLLLGHSYVFNYSVDGSNFLQCETPPYHSHAFGPVTGDTSIVVSPSDPSTN
jgi:hypothetical protein